MARVVLESLTKIFTGAKGEEVRAVDKLNLVVENKQLLVLLGPSGCGKSTTLRLISGLEEASQGTISMDGKVIDALEPKDRDIAMVFQNYALFPHLTVFENISLGLKLRRIPKPEIQSRVKETAEILGLTECLDRKPSALSGGQRQRVALGRAIVRKPKLFLLDEPLSNLDPHTRAQLRSEILKLQRRLETTMIYVTHDQFEAMAIGDVIAVMKQGIIHQTGCPMSIYHYPANLFVAGFVGWPPMNLLQGMVFEKSSELYFQSAEEQGNVREELFMLRISKEQRTALSDWTGKTIILGLRPENIRPAGATNENVLKARIVYVERTGSETCVQLDIGGQLLTARFPASEEVEKDQTLCLALDMARACFFDPVSGVRSA